MLFRKLSSGSSFERTPCASLRWRSAPVSPKKTNYAHINQGRTGDQPVEPVLDAALLGSLQISPLREDPLINLQHVDQDWGLVKACLLYIPLVDFKRIDDWIEIQDSRPAFVEICWPSRDSLSSKLAPLRQFFVTAAAAAVTLSGSCHA